MMRTRRGSARLAKVSVMVDALAQATGAPPSSSMMMCQYFSTGRMPPSTAAMKRGSVKIDASD